MADCSMEPQVWVPCNFQQADWSMEHAVCVLGVPESESTETTTFCLEETSVNCCSRGQQLVQYAAAATTCYDNPVPVEFQIVADDLHADYKLGQKKMYRYPPIFRNLDARYTVPAMVSIGPYHHGQEHLRKAEEAKHAAAYACIMASEHCVQDMYDAVVRVAEEAYSLYYWEKTMTSGMDYKKDFCPMLFFDACFLVQWMLMDVGETASTEETIPWLSNYLDLNRKTIHRDCMLLENQLPWVVVETLMQFTPEPLKIFKNFTAGLRRDLQARVDDNMQTRKFYDIYNLQSNILVPHSTRRISNRTEYQPPHLLGLFRVCTVGKREDLQTPAGGEDVMAGKEEKADVTSFSVSAIELAEIGITLTPSKTTEIAQMGIQNMGVSSTELRLAPLCLTYKRASFLVNMAAFEFTAKPQEEEFAVSNYLRLLGMLVNREEDVQELRSKNLLQGGGGLTNDKALHFFTSLQDLGYGEGYSRTIEDIEAYKKKYRNYVTVHVIRYRYTKTILLVLSVMASVVSILGVLISAIEKK